jgi:NAD(P)-dependent dehydrogenase (short-subunit alcohol dehydrogenase family)
LGKLDGRVAVVTGAASGIGLAAARRFGAEGATVVMTDFNREELQRVAEQQDGDVRFDPFTVDVTRNQDLEALRDHVLATYGHADILFANAGVATFAPLGDVSEEAFDRTIATNLKGTFFTVQTLLPALRDGSSIILMSSMVAKKAVPAFSAYSATKAAISALARVFALELGERRIRVNSLAPGNTETAIGRHAGFSEAENDDFFARTAATTPLGRNGQADEIASAALYLASGDSAFVTGAEITIDGGHALC